MAGVLLSEGEKIFILHGVKVIIGRILFESHFKKCTLKGEY